MQLFEHSLLTVQGLPVWAIPTVGLVVAAIAVTLTFSRRKGDPHEPPYVHGASALFFRYGLNAVDELAKRHINTSPHGIFRVSLFGIVRFYVVVSPELVAAVQGRSKHTSFKPTMIRTTASLAQQSPRGREILLAGMEQPDGGQSHTWAAMSHKINLRGLAPGFGLDQLRVDFLVSYDKFIASLTDSVYRKQQNVDMWLWLAEAMTVASAYAIWGPTNPYSTDPELWKTFWEFHEHYNVLYFHFAPNLLSPKGVRAGRKIAAAFAEYQRDADAVNAGSTLGKGRIDFMQKLGMTSSEIAKMSVPQSYGQGGNTIPTAYAALSYILTDPVTVSRVRAELDKLVEFQDSDDANGNGKMKRKAKFPAHTVLENCPLLVSCIYESMRLTALATTFRSVLTDYVLDVPPPSHRDASTPADIKDPSGPQPPVAQYLLKANSFIWSAGSVIHNSGSFYDAPQTFQPDRFLKYQNAPTQISGLFRGFGGGTSICIGRHFAMSMVSAVVGSLLVRFDFTGPDGEPTMPLEVPRRGDLRWGNAMPKPSGRTLAGMTARKGWENVEWVS